MAHLTKMEIDRVSLVDRGANGRRFAILKRDDGVDPEKRSLLSKLAGALGFELASVEKAETKTVDGVEGFRPEHFGYAPDPVAPAGWKLRLFADPADDTPDARLIGAAVAALGPKGFRGQRVEIPTDDLPKVKARVRAAWRKAHPDAAEDDMPETIAKAQQTFASLVAGQQLTEALDDQFWTLKDALWSAIYARDEDDQLLSPEARQALVAQSLDEFKAYLIGQMEAGIAKSDELMPDPLAAGLESAIRKVGKKISAARLERLKAAADALAAVLADVEGSDDSAVEKRADAQEADMTSEEIERITKTITDTVAAAVAPIVTDVAVLKSAIEKPAGETGDSDGEEDVTPAQVAKVLSAVLDRLETVEKAQARGSRTSLGGQDAGDVKKSIWAGMF